jgi:hypothetical protein
MQKKLGQISVSILASTISVQKNKGHKVKSEANKLISITIACVLLTLQPMLARAEEASRGIGGTGHSASEGGVGGTGHVGSEKGIGGTGHTQSDGGIGGTGIVGIITGFGSIWVNGLEVQYDAKTQMASNTTAATANELAIGQVVAIEASGINNEFKANKISVVNAVEGQITAVDATNGKLTVLGQTVIATTQTLTSDPKNAQSTAAFNQGDYVKVSGLRKANGEIMASRIERSAPIAESNLIGPITSINGNTIEVYGLQISHASTGIELSIGQEISVTGQMRGGILIAREISPSPSMQLYGHTEHINLQGYVGARSSDGKIKVGNLEVVLSDPAMLPKTLSPDQLVQISGRFANDHRLIADRIEFSRDRPDRVQFDRGNNEHGGHERVEHGDHAERPDRSDHIDHIDRPDSPDRPDHSEVHKQSEHSH